MKTCCDLKQAWSRLHDGRLGRGGHRRKGRWCCDNDVIADVATTASEMASSPDQICCGCVNSYNSASNRHSATSNGLRGHYQTGPNTIKSCNVQHLNYSYSSRDFDFHADFNTMNTKTSFLAEDDDYFLSLSKDRRFVTPIPVSEL